MKGLSILGSTGSIGLNTLDVVRRNRDRFRVIGLGAHSDVDRLEKQVREFHPLAVSLFDEEGTRQLRRRLRDIEVEVHSGPEGLVKLSILAEVEMVVSAVVGAAGLIPTLAAIDAGKDIALANKESLVVAGELITRKSSGKTAVIPIDSEHSALFQALVGEDWKAIRRLILTGSGGPFRCSSIQEMQQATLKDALKHPNWCMGKKITIDCATLMNKGFEVIEARWFFHVAPERIEVLIHPQSIVHSLVEFWDGSVIAQLGIPDMRVPISYALSYPNRLANQLPSLDLAQVGALTFERPDLDRFPCLRYAYQALETGGTMPAVLNAANEVAVQAFLAEEIAFPQIPQIIAETMLRHTPQPLQKLEDVLQADQWGRQQAAQLVAASGSSERNR